MGQDSDHPEPAAPRFAELSDGEFINAAMRYAHDSSLRDYDLAILLGMALGRLSMASRGAELVPLPPGDLQPPRNEKT